MNSFAMGSQVLVRCPMCGRPDMVPLGMTYIFPNSCEMRLVCPDDECEGTVYLTMSDHSLVTTFSDGLYGLIRVDAPDGPFLRLEGGGLSAKMVRSESGEPIAAGDTDLFPKDVFKEAMAEAGRWFARRLNHSDRVCTNPRILENRFREENLHGHARHTIQEVSIDDRY